MRLKELIFQRTDSGELKKFVFTQNYNLIEATKIGLKSGTFRSLLNSAIFPEYCPKEGELDLEGDSGKIRLGITFSHLNVIYRFVRDLRGQAASLSKFDDKSSQFVEISNDNSFIRKAFENSFRIPESNLFQRLCIVEPTLMVEDFNKWKKKIKDKETSYFDNLDQDAELRQKIGKLKALKKEKDNIELVSACEFELDGLQAKLFNVTDKLQKIKAKEDDLQIIEGELAEYKNLEGVDFPGGIIERLKAYDKLKEKKDNDLLRLDNKMEDTLNKLATLKIEPVQKDKALVACSVFALAFFAMALFMPKFLVPFLVLFFCCIGFVAWRVIVFIKKRENEENLNKQIKALGEDKAVIGKKFDIETSVVKKFIEEIKASSADDAIEMIKRKEQLDKNYAGAKKEIVDYKTRLGHEQISAEKSKIEKEIKALEEKMRNVPPASIDPNELNGLIEGLKDEIGEENLMKHFESESPPRSKDPYRFLINSTAKHLKIEPGKLIDALKPTYIVNLQILSNKYFQNVTWDDGIESFSLDGRDSPYLPSDLGPDEELIAYFALQFTLMQILSKYQPVPSVIFGRLQSSSPEMKKETFFKALTHLSKTTQILHVF